MAPAKAGRPAHGVSGESISTSDRALSRLYSIANRLLDVQALDTWSDRIINEFIARYYFARVAAHAVGEADHTIRIGCGLPSTATPGGPPAFEIANGRCYVSGETSYLHVDGSAVVIQPRASRAIEIWIGETPHARRPSAINNVLSYGFQASLRRCGLFEIHAAGAVAPHQGGGALFIGNSGSGKSTLILRLAASGWRYLSDDVLALKEHAGKVEAQALRRWFAITDSTARACDVQPLGYPHGAQRKVGPAKHRLQPTQLFPDSFRLTSVPGVLFFTSITREDESRVARLSPSEAMTGLVKLTLWTPYDSSMARAHFNLLSQLVKQTVAYDLIAGRDILDDPPCAARLLAPLMK